MEEEQQSELPQGEPLVALLDGLPLTGHRLLDGRLIIDDPDGYEGEYQAQERVHWHRHGITHLPRRLERGQ